MNHRQWTAHGTVTIGKPEFRTEDDFFRAIKVAKLMMGRYVEGYIKAMIATLEKSQRDIKLARVAVRDLGFTEITQTTTFLEAVAQAGLVALPPETGVYYRLQNSPEPYEDRFHIFAEPVIVKNYGPARLFIVEDAISADCGGGGIGLMPDCVWVCGLP